MEEAQTIPLFFLGLCCMIATPLVGFSALAYIRFKMKDKELSGNILKTIILVAILPVFYIGFEFISTLMVMPKGCFECSNSIISHLPEILISSLSILPRMILLSLPVSFLLSFVFVVPITLIARKIKKSKASQSLIP